MAQYSILDTLEKKKYKLSHDEKNINVNIRNE